MKSSATYVCFASLCLLSSAILWRPLADTFGLALHNDEFTHILLILPISGALIFSQWNSHRSKASPSVRTGAIFFTAGILLALSARWWLIWHTPDVQLAVGMLALVISWIAAFVFCFGTRIARSLVFPLCFLFWMVPIPSFLLVRIVQLLQRGSAIAAWLLFSVVGVPTMREGVVLSIPGLNIEVAQECSSIRSSLILFVTTMVLAHVLLRTPWRKALVVLLAIPLSVAKNGLRIFAIGMLGTRIDPGFLTGRLHRHGGTVFLLIALAVVTLVVWFLRRGENAVRSTSHLNPA